MIRNLLIFLILFCSISVILFTEQEIAVSEKISDAMLVTELKPVNPKVVMPFLFGHEAFYADLFWVQTIQYTADQKMPNLFDYLYKMTSLITDLDPRFEQVYIWSSLTMSYTSSKNLDNLGKIRAANEILLKGWNFAQNDVVGWKHTSRFWMIPQVLGFNYGFELKDREKALEYTRALMSIPDLPQHMKTWAAGLFREKTDADKGMDFMESLLAAETIQAQINMTDDEAVRDKLKGKLLAFYKKINNDEYGNQRMAEIQQQVRKLVETWRKDYPFLPFSFYTLLHRHETKFEIEQERNMYSLFFPTIGGQI